MKWFATQLGRPHGLGTPLIAMMLNRANRATIGQAVDLLDLSSGAVAADLGFGGGLGVKLLLEKVGPGGHVHAVDYSPAIVKRATRRFLGDIRSGRLAIHEGSLTQLPLTDGSVDGAISINTLYFIAELDRAFAELDRVLRAAGTVVVGIGDPQNMARLPMTPYGFRLRPVDEIVAVAKSADLVLRKHVRVGEGEKAGHLLAFGHGHAA